MPLKWILKETVRMHMIYVAQITIIVDTVMKIRISKKGEEFLDKGKVYCLQRKQGAELLK
jgi:hypothetical protein